jgi:anti-anti-sigma factor
VSAAPAPNHAWSVQVSLTAGADALTLSIVGRLGTAGAAELREACTTGLVRGGRVQLDLSQVDYISSAGLSALRDLAQQVHDADGMLEVVRSSEAVRLALRLAGAIPHLAVPSLDGPDRE